jgi:trimeric autotransporter adhesin
MSATTRRMLEDALGLSLVRDAALALTAGLTVAQLPQLPAAAVQRVTALGFSAADAVAAAVATQGPTDLTSDSSSGTSVVADSGAAVRTRAAELLEWLCLHVDEGALPEGFDPRGRMLDVVQPGAKQAAKRTATAATSAAASNAAAAGAIAGASVKQASAKQSKQAHKQPTIATTTATDTAAAGGSAVAVPARQLTALQRKLMQYGFSEAAVTAATVAATNASDWLTVAAAAAPLLSSACTDSGSATPNLAWLTNSTSSTTSSSSTSSSASNNASSDSWEDAAAADDELEALEAIFGQQVTRLPAPRGSPGGSPCVHTALQIDLGCIEGIGDSPQGDVPEAHTWLDVFLPAGGLYPGATAEPLALLRCAQLTVSSSSSSSTSSASNSAALLAVQVELAAKVAALQGQCCVYDLVVWAQSDAPELLQQALQQQTAAAVAVPAAAAATAAATAAEAAAAGSSADTSSASSRRAVPLVRDPDATGAVWGDADDVSDNVSDHVSDDTHSISSSSSSAATASTATASTTGGSSSSTSCSRGQAKQRTDKQTGTRTTNSVQPPRGVPAHERKRGRERIESSKEYAAVQRQRQCLPAAKARAELLAMVRASQVVLVAGETGCGKTTQVCDSPHCCNCQTVVLVTVLL